MLADVAYWHLADISMSAISVVIGGKADMAKIGQCREMIQKPTSANFY
jgi:hypothetical protein